MASILNYCSSVLQTLLAPAGSTIWRRPCTGCSPYWSLGRHGAGYSTRWTPSTSNPSAKPWWTHTQRMWRPSIRTHGERVRGSGFTLESGGTMPWARCPFTCGRPYHSLMSGVPYTFAWAPTIYKWLWAATQASSMGHACANVVASLLWRISATLSFIAASPLRLLLCQLSCGCVWWLCAY